MDQEGTAGWHLNSDMPGLGALKKERILLYKTTKIKTNSNTIPNKKIEQEQMLRQALAA
jgi:hypothetical protein